MLVACARCDTPRTVPLAELPPDLTIMRELLRLRCQACRGWIGTATLDNGLPGWRRRIVKVWGPGSSA